MEIHEYLDDLTAMKRSDVNVLMIVTLEFLEIGGLTIALSLGVNRLIVNPQRMKLRNCSFYSRKFAASCKFKLHVYSPCTTQPLIVILQEIVETLLPLSKEIVDFPRPLFVLFTRTPRPHLVLLSVDCSWILSSF